jgi:hypothetical protein
MNVSRLTRLRKLETSSSSVGECDSPSYVRVRHAFGESAPSLSLSGPSCRRCGEHHVVVLRERVVTNREQLQSCQV